jgi:hypothetical protein
MSTAKEHGLTKDEFVTEYKRLVDTQMSTATNVGCVECTDCAGSIDCVFCKGCVRCYRTRYSTDCRDSALLTHCQGCTESRSLAYSQNCDHCGDSNYLVQCAYCFECDYCFGCVGLVKKDFHILNQKYSRAEYFRLVAKLRVELGIAALG